MRLRRCAESDVRSQKSEVRGQRSEVRGQRSEVRGQKSEVRSQRSEVRGQKSEVRGQKSEVRSQRSENHFTRRSLLRAAGCRPYASIGAFCSWGKQSASRHRAKSPLSPDPSPARGEGRTFSAPSRELVFVGSPLSRLRVRIFFVAFVFFVVERFSLRSLR